ncbi:response regulator transcription factor [Acidimicrobiia bacterium EGI L10123]|uniref:winged helix-turn-helix domain-containing protein n=1 Tax=Salinilacustrithrix flava TaxID=2957203 RepID=UPI003D7C17C7|nr:response regulator transcription factor [Acidimicrobiia bacterium EGI L10123]
MPTTTWAGERPQILVLGRGDAVPEVRAVLDRCRHVGRVDTAERGRTEAVRGADLVVVVVDEGEPHAVDPVVAVRGETDCPIVVVSGPRPDRFQVFDAGADDVAASPIDPAELTARVAVRLARSSHGRDEVRHGALVVDPARRVVRLDGESVALTAKEFDLLEHLVRHPGQTFSRDMLLEAVWNSSTEWQQGRTVNEHVHRLRRKLGGGWIATVHGVGYRFDPDAR